MEVDSYPSGDEQENMEQANMEQEANMNENGEPISLSDPTPRNPKKYLNSTPFAPKYHSIFTLTPPANELLHLFQHVNCSYLSTPGVAPSLLQLKQHAQSLTILIKNLTVSTSGGVIDNANIPAVSDTQSSNQEEVEVEFRDGETYDWLNDLTKPYWGPKNERLRRHHELPFYEFVKSFTARRRNGERWKEVCEDSGCLPTA